MAAELHRASILPRPLPDLPPEITLDQILPRLPGKSILRFKCVSKQWYAFLTSPMFTNLHFYNHINKDDHHNSNKLLLSSNKGPCKFFTIDCESPNDGLTAISSLPFETSHATTIKVLSSLHGLVCVGIEINKSYSGLKLWNPLTGECSRLRIGENPIMIRALGLYYSSLDDDYRLLRVGAAGVYIYSLKSDSWREHGTNTYYDGWFSSDHWSNSIWLNEKLYFLRERKWPFKSPLDYEIIRFDTKTEKFSNITVPFFKRNIWPYLCGLSVVRGHVHFFVAFIEKYRFTKMELWRMDEDEDEDGFKGWMKVVTCSKMESFTPAFQRESLAFYKLMYPRYEGYLCEYMNNGRLHLMRNGNLIMHSGDEGYFCKVDLEKNTKDVSSSSMYKDILVQGTYVETFVSPNRYMRTVTDPLN